MELSAQMDVWQVWSSGRVVACHTRGTSTSGSNPTGGFILYSKKNAIIAVTSTFLQFFKFFLPPAVALSMMLLHAKFQLSPSIS